MKIIKEYSKKIDLKSLIYTIIWSTISFILKKFLVKQIIAIQILWYVGITFLIIGFTLSICEKKFNIPFFNAIPNWYGVGVLFNACSLVGIGIALVFNSWCEFLLGGLMITFVLLLQRSIMNKT